MTHVLDAGQMKQHDKRVVRPATIHRGKKFAIVLSEGFSLMHAARLAEAFGLANELVKPYAAEGDNYELDLLSSSGGIVLSASGVPLWTGAADGSDLSGFHGLFVVGGFGSASAGLAADDKRLLAWLRQVYPRTAVVDAIGSGRLTLAVAGLERKQAAGIRIVDNVASAGLYVTHDAWPAFGGDDSAFENALAIVKHDRGYETAHSVAKRLISAAGGRVAESVFDSREAHASDVIRDAAYRMRITCVRPVSIADAARAAAMSERNFLRRFKLELGVPPSEFVFRVRLEKARQLLAETELPADKIARHAGFGNGERLAKVFRQHLSMSPTEFRLSERSRTTIRD